MRKFNLTITTPNGLAFTGEVEKVIVTTSCGQIGILRNHTSLFSLLDEGELKITVDNEDHFYSIGGGFLEVSKNKAKILVTRAIKGDEIIEGQVLEAQKKASELLKTKPSKEDVQALESAFRRSLIDLKVARKSKRRRTSEIPL